VAAIDFAVPLSELFGKLLFLWLILAVGRIAEMLLSAYKQGNLSCV
jgi:hypothetical protein